MRAIKMPGAYDDCKSNWGSTLEKEEAIAATRAAAAATLAALAATVRSQRRLPRSRSAPKCSSR